VGHSKTIRNQARKILPSVFSKHTNPPIQIDWNIVATANEISNGHAARMRFHRLRQAMEGISTKHRVPKTIGDVPEKGKAKGKADRKTRESRNAKELAVKRKLADISDDEEEPLAHVKARMRMKEEMEDSEDEYVNSETEEKRVVTKGTKQEENRIAWERNRDVPLQEKVKIEPEENQISTFGEQETNQIYTERGEDHALALLQRETTQIKDEIVEDDGFMVIDIVPTALEDVRIKEGRSETVVEV
jgi:hypothetical protein